MPALRDLEIGVMFWAGRDPVETLREVKALGVRCGQLGIPGDMALESAAEPWARALKDEDFTLVTVFCSYTGESYEDVPTVEKTVGFIPPATRDEREERTKQISHFASAIGVKGIACHVGFIPEDPENSEYKAVRGLVRRIADHAALHGQTFALETGQEPADILLKFLRDVGKTNVGINFDPANLIMYGTGDPIQALGVLGNDLLSVHVKDGEWPPKGVADALGTEKKLGQGAVGMEQFLAKLKQIGFKGVINIEREGAATPEERLQDIREGVELLKKIRE